MADTLDVRPAVSYESRLSTGGSCQGHLLLADAAHDLGLPDWDSSTALLSGNRLAEWLQSANFQ